MYAQGMHQQQRGNLQAQGNSQYAMTNTQRDMRIRQLEGQLHDALQVEQQRSQQHVISPYRQVPVAVQHINPNHRQRGLNNRNASPQMQRPMTDRGQLPQRGRNVRRQSPGPMPAQTERGSSNHSPPRNMYMANPAMRSYSDVSPPRGAISPTIPFHINSGVAVVSAQQQIMVMPNGQTAFMQVHPASMPVSDMRAHSPMRSSSPSGHTMRSSSPISHSYNNNDDNNNNNANDNNNGNGDIDIYQEIGDQIDPQQQQHEQRQQRQRQRGMAAPFASPTRRGSDYSPSAPGSRTSPMPVRTMSAPLRGLGVSTSGSGGQRGIGARNESPQHYSDFVDRSPERSRDFRPLTPPRVWADDSVLESIRNVHSTDPRAVAELQAQATRLAHALARQEAWRERVIDLMESAHTRIQRLQDDRKILRKKLDQAREQRDLAIEQAGQLPTVQMENSQMTFALNELVDKLEKNKEALEKQKEMLRTVASGSAAQNQALKKQLQEEQARADAATNAATRAKAMDEDLHHEVEQAIEAAANRAASSAADAAECQARAETAVQAKNLAEAELAGARREMKELQDAWAKEQEERKKAAAAAAAAAAQLKPKPWPVGDKERAEREIQILQNGLQQARQSEATAREELSQLCESSLELLPIDIEGLEAHDGSETARDVSMSRKDHRTLRANLEAASRLAKSNAQRHLHGVVEENQKLRKRLELARKAVHAMARADAVVSGDGGDGSAGGAGDIMGATVERERRREALLQALGPDDAASDALSEYLNSDTNVVNVNADANAATNSNSSSNNNINNNSNPGGGNRQGYTSTSGPSAAMVPRGSPLQQRPQQVPPPPPPLHEINGHSSTIGPPIEAGARYYGNIQHPWNSLLPGPSPIRPNAVTNMLDRNRSTSPPRDVIRVGARPASPVFGSQVHHVPQRDTYTLSTAVDHALAYNPLTTSPSPSRAPLRSGTRLQATHSMQPQQVQQRVQHQQQPPHLSSMPLSSTSQTLRGTSVSNHNYVPYRAAYDALGRSAGVALSQDGNHGAAPAVSAAMAPAPAWSSPSEPRRSRSNPRPGASYDTGTNTIQGSSFDRHQRVTTREISRNAPLPTDPHAPRHTGLFASLAESGESVPPLLAAAAEREANARRWGADVPETEGNIVLKA